MLCLGCVGAAFALHTAPVKRDLVDVTSHLSETSGGGKWGLRRRSLASSGPSNGRDALRGGLLGRRRFQYGRPPRICCPISRLATRANDCVAESAARGPLSSLGHKTVPSDDNGTFGSVRKTLPSFARLDGRWRLSPPIDEKSKIQRRCSRSKSRRRASRTLAHSFSSQPDPKSCDI